MLYVSYIDHQSLQEFYPPGLQLNPHQLIFIDILCILHLLHILLGGGKKNNQDRKSHILSFDHVQQCWFTPVSCQNVHF